MSSTCNEEANCSISIKSIPLLVVSINIDQILGLCIMVVMAVFILTVTAIYVVPIT